MAEIGLASVAYQLGLEMLVSFAVVFAHSAGGLELED